MKSTSEFRIAVSGHRYISTDEQIVKRVRSLVTKMVNDHTEKTIYLLSALAEGGDQLVAAIAAELPKIKIIVPLPMPREDYLTDFISDRGRERFRVMITQVSEVIDLPPVENRNAAYRQLGNYLVDHCDCLIAIWNGEFNHEDGGTGEVVAAAKSSKKPIYWVYCENEKAGVKNPLHGTKEIGEIKIF